MTASVAERIALFEQVRDRPYGYDFQNREQDASCISKSAELAKLLRDAGLEVRHVCCKFRWIDQAMPPELIAKAVWPESEHHFLRVRIPETGAWVDVDPTWDALLESEGFPVAHWDGLNSTPLAMVPYKFFSPEESEEMINVRKNTSDDHLRAMSRPIFRGFYDSLNRWVESKRYRPGEPHA